MATQAAQFPGSLRSTKARWQCALATVAGVAFLAMPVHAQITARANAVAPHDRMRIHVQAASGRKLVCTGVAASVTADTIQLDTKGSCPSLTFGVEDLTAMEIGNGAIAGRPDHAIGGMAIGATVIGLLANYAIGDGCRIDPCGQGSITSEVVTIGGVIGGGLLGLAIGGRMKKNGSWVHVSRMVPVRVLGLAIAPGVMVR